MNFKLSQIAVATGGTLTGDDIIVNSLVTDSRKAEKGSIFAVFKGERVDGFDYIPKIDQNDGICYLTDRAPTGVKNSYILVDDVLTAVGKIANLYINTLDVKRVCVTGSVGKTTTKNFITSALSECVRVHSALGNRNNELGLPLTVLDITDSHDAVVLEMGMRGLGQIEYLCNIARPDVSVITNIGISHMELLGSRENILKAKSEIIDALDGDGVAVLNGDDDMLKTLRPTQKTLWYGIDNPDLDIYATDVVDNKYTLCVLGKTYPVTLSVLGIHNVYNSLAAIAVGIALGYDIERLIKGVENFTGDGSRQNIYTFNGIRIFDDTYNASPDSMRAAMSVMSGFLGDKILVLGDMLELGEKENEFHAELKSAVYGCGAKTVICIGSRMKSLYDALENVEKYHFLTGDDAFDTLKTVVKTGDNVLFKGSNSMRLCDLVKKFKGEN